MAEDEECAEPYIRSKKVPIPKNKTSFFGSHKGFINENIDKSSLYTFTNPLIRIEYPGNVRNVDNAIRTLGGMHEIRKCTNSKTKLELKFHPANQFNKGCILDKETNVGLLIIVKQTEDKATSYEIVNAVNISFKFNRICDFQYLPLISKDTPETEESEVEYLHDKIVPKSIPTLEWLNKEEHPVMLIASNFARFDLPQDAFQTDATKTFLSLVRPGDNIAFSSKKKNEGPALVPFLHINFLKPDVKVPDEAPVAALEYIKERKYEKHFSIIHALFEKRPIWKRSAVVHQTGFAFDTVKAVLPGIAYYCYKGPWKVCYIKFGYNPLQDFNSRIYQVLDIRIRSKEGIQLKVKAKRDSVSKHFKEKTTQAQSCLENEYILKPNVIPPARHMYYQYCDIKIPEIQEMITKLPKLPLSTKYDSNNGWLPLCFTDHCKEIVKKNFLMLVKNELLSEANELNIQASSQGTSQEGGIVSLYCSKMLSNLRRGKSNVSEEEASEQYMEHVDLIDDDNREQHIDVTEVVNSLPERIQEDSEDEDSDMDIDMDAVEEINEIILLSK